VDEIERAVRRLEIEEMALAKEPTRPSPSGWPRCAASWPTRASSWPRSATAGATRRSTSRRSPRPRSSWRRCAGRRAGRARPRLERASELRYGRIPELERQLAAAEPS
jgi:ATP-dependent Clp protease ATP-binding subunit ClpB